MKQIDFDYPSIKQINRGLVNIYHRCVSLNSAEIAAQFSGVNTEPSLFHTLSHVLIIPF